MPRCGWPRAGWRAARRCSSIRASTCCPSRATCFTSRGNDRSLSHLHRRRRARRDRRQDHAAGDRAGGAAARRRGRSSPEFWPRRSPTTRSPRWSGSEVAGLLDAPWFRIAVALGFIAMAAWTLVPDKLDDDEEVRHARRRVPDHAGRLLPGRNGRQDPDRDHRAGRAISAACSWSRPEPRWG